MSTITINTAGTVATVDGAPRPIFRTRITGGPHHGLVQPFIVTRQGEEQHQPKILRIAHYGGNGYPAGGYLYRRGIFGRYRFMGADRS